MIRLDDNADAPVLKAAWQAYRQAARTLGNPRSPHAAGAHAREALDQARARVAQQLGARPEEIVFTSGGTEADALALHGVLAGHTGAHAITSGLEHPAVRDTLEGLARAGRIELTTLTPTRTGLISAAQVEAALTDRTVLVSIVLACNETGVIQPLGEIARVCRPRGILCHCDAVQAASRIFVNVQTLGVDLLSVSGHKLGAVAGIGALYVRTGITLKPVYPVRTESLAGAMSLAVALEAGPSREERAGLAHLRDHLEAGLADRAGPVEILGRGAPRLANTTCVRFEGLDADGLMMALDLSGIATSTGSACSTGAIEPSPILLSMGLSAAEARCALRFSLARGVRDDQIEHVITTATQLVHKMQAG